MRKKIPVIVCLIILCGFHRLQAQSNRITPVSPEAAALAKMVNYPVDLNTGVPSISVPFYTIKAGGLELPISFDYNASGFKINERATRIGLGWSLSADIQISRTINGLDDFKPNVGYIYNALAKGYIPATSNYPFYATGYRNAYDLAAGEVDAAPDKFNYKLLNKSGSFFFQKNSSGGVSGIVPVPFDNIKITYSNNSFIIVDSDGTTYHFATPQTTPQDVTQALAAGRESTGGISYDYSSCVNCQTTAWKCKKIVNNVGTDEITFTYTNKAVAKYTNFQERIEFYDNPAPCDLTAYYRSDPTGALYGMTTYEQVLNTAPFWQISSPKYLEVFANAKALFHIPYTSSGSLVDKSYTSNTNFSESGLSVAGTSLSAINFRGGSVTFSSADQLTFIELKDAGNNPLKQVYLYQSLAPATYDDEAKYFNGQNFNGTLYLDSLHIKGEGYLEERYAMLYKDKFCFGDHLKGRDAWGYANESTVEIESANHSPYLAFPTKNIIQPRIYGDIFPCINFAENVPMSFGGDNWSEESSNEGMQHGILKRLIYPTGGFVDFDFEANQYKEVYASQSSPWSLNLQRLCGGLRVRSIGYYDGHKPTPGSYTYYRYGEFEEGTGVMISKPVVTSEPYKYNFDVATDVQQIAYVGVLNGSWCYDKSCLGVLTTENKTTYRPTSFHTYTYASGSPIYYTHVTEYKHDLGKQSGKTVHEFYPPEEFHDWTYAPMLDKERIPDTDLSYIKASWMEGLQKSTSTYKFTEGAGFELINRKSYEYSRHIKSQLSVAYAYFATIYEVVQGSFIGNNWDLYDESKNFMDNSGGFSNYRVGEYGIPVGKMVMTKETEETFDGPSNVLSTSKQYSYNNTYLQPSSILTIDSKGHQIVKTLKYAYDFTGVYEQMKDKNMISQVVEEVITDNTTPVEISRKKTNYAAIAEGFGFIAPENIQSSSGGAPLETDMVFDKYDQYGNVLQLTGRNGIPVSYLWGYNHLYPVAELTGVAYSSIPSLYLSNVGIITPANDNALRTLLNGLRSSFSSKLISTYTHKRLIGMTSQTSPNGRTDYFEYDTYGRLVTARDQNQDITQTLAYQMAGPTELGLFKYYVNFPVMKTHNYTCNNGTSDVTVAYNHYIPAGKYYNSDEYGTNNMAKIDALAGDGRETPCPPSSDMATIKLFSLFDYWYAVPGVEIDFIQNGSVVASQSFMNNNLSFPPYQDKILKLPPGEYTVSFRVDPSTRFFDVFIDFYFMAVTESYGKGLRSKDTITIVKDKVYEINVTNIM